MMYSYCTSVSSGRMTHFFEASPQRILNSQDVTEAQVFSFNLFH